LVAFLAYCLQITLTRRLHGLAPGLTVRSALQKFAAVQMIDVHPPTTDGREIILSRYTEPEPELRLLINRMKLDRPAQPPQNRRRRPPGPTRLVVKTFSVTVLISLMRALENWPNPRSRVK
jgi:hypothetical protein